MNPNKIQAIIVDVDGVLTDGGYYYSKLGLVVKKFNTRDACGMHWLRQKFPKIKIHALSHCDDPLTHKRVEIMKFDFPCLLGVKSKIDSLKELCNEMGYDPLNVCYIGDSLADIECLNHVGIPCCPSDALWAVKKQCVCIFNRKGGEGILEELVCVLENYQNELS